MFKEEEHKELHKKIWDCKCLPIHPSEDYCENCKYAVIEFMNKHGAGALTRDVDVEDFQKEIVRLNKENMSLSKKLEDKIKRVEELKTQLTGSGNSEVKDA